MCLRPVFAGLCGLVAPSWGASSACRGPCRGATNVHRRSRGAGSGAYRRLGAPSPSRCSGCVVGRGVGHQPLLPSIRAAAAAGGVGRRLWAGGGSMEHIFFQANSHTHANFIGSVIRANSGD